MIDVAVIGAGINGTVTAYMLSQEGVDVKVFDQTGIASGGSGAAGAFLSPKFVKGGELKIVVNTALDEAFNFYKQVNPELFHQYPLLHIAKNEKDANNLFYVKKNDPIELLENPPFIPENEFIYTSKSAIVQAKKMCEYLLKDIVFEKLAIDSLEYIDGIWLINKTIQAKSVVLATGAYRHLIEESYLKNAIRGIWGHRVDIRTSLKNNISIHQFVSISPSQDDVVSIGATHDVHFDPQKQHYDFLKGREELIQKASKTVVFNDIDVIRDYVGLRSGSSDYMPLLGKIVDSKKTVQKLSNKEIESKNQEYNNYVYYKNLYMINGSAGYGFVLAPYLARRLVNLIIKEKELPRKLEVARFFIRYIRRNR